MPRAATPEELQAAFTPALFGEFERCANCHYSGNADARDQAWGGRSDWAGAVAVLANAPEGGGSSQTGEARLRGLYNDEIDHDDHEGIADPTFDADMEALVDLAVNGFVPDPNDPACQENPEPGCRPASDAEIAAAFTPALNAGFTVCANCHFGGSATARDIAWGGQNDWPGAIRTLAEAGEGGDSGQTGEARLRGLYKNEIAQDRHQNVDDAAALDVDMEAMVDLIVDGICE